MARIRQLDWYQRGILILLLALALVFAVIYRVRIARVGFFISGQDLRPVGGKRRHRVFRENQR